MVDNQMGVVRNILEQTSNVDNANRIRYLLELYRSND